MKNNLKISDVGADYICGWEQYRGEAYQDSADVWTYGYGATKKADGTPVKKGDTITQADAKALFKAQVATREATVNKMVVKQLEQHEFDALVAFVYNVGGGALASSTLLNRVNSGVSRDEQIEAAYLMWNKVTNPKTGKKEVSNGLTRRRKSEAHLYNTGEVNYYEELV